MTTGLITGFGPFREVTDNPSARLAAALDGRVLPGVDGPIRIVARVLPVAYGRGIDAMVAEAGALQASFVLGFGVATSRSAAFVETRARRIATGEDVDGRCPGALDAGPETLEMPAFGHALAAHLGCATSDDAGTYVCNAWMRAAATRLTVPVAFVHIPPDGLAPDPVAAAIAAAWGEISRG